MMTGHLSVSGEVFFMYNVICQLAVWAELMLAHRKLRFFWGTQSKAHRHGYSPITITISSNWDSHENPPPSPKWWLGRETGSTNLRSCAPRTRNHVTQLAAHMQPTSVAVWGLHLLKFGAQWACFPSCREAVLFPNRGRTTLPVHFSGTLKHY